VSFCAYTRRSIAYRRGKTADAKSVDYFRRSKLRNFGLRHLTLRNFPQLCTDVSLQSAPCVPYTFILKT
jgi:hypothetical protein